MKNEKNAKEDSGFGRLFLTHTCGIGMLAFCIFDTANGGHDKAIFYLGGFIGVYSPMVFSFLVKSCLRTFKGGDLDD